MSRIKEILCLNHSHLDVGYTHPQSMIMELQCDYINQAIDLCVQTADWPEESRFRWTCEATYPLIKWFETSSPERKELIRSLIKQGYISVAALPMHTTPSCTAMQLTQYLQQLDAIRELTGSNIKTAINHDVNGQPWTLPALLLDSNVEFYITGINIHFGGIPFPRPYAFCWETQDGRSLPSFIGEHYSLFSQFFFTNQGSTEKMHEGVIEYVNRIEQSGWQEDFVYLTATNPPLYDNNCPDADLADLVRRYNDENHEQKIRFVTPEMLFERIQKIGINKLEKHAGDWTDYWNFGCASTAREVKINKRAKNLLQKNDFLECINSKPSQERYIKMTERAYQNALLFDEHTWGAAESVSKPDQEETYAQLNHKKEFAYTAADLSAYLVNYQMERLMENPFQSDKQDGIAIINPTGVTIRHELKVPTYMKQPGRKLSAIRAHDCLPYEKKDKNSTSYGMVEMPPFSKKVIPFADLVEIEGQKAKGCTIHEYLVETPFYHITLHTDTGRIIQIQDKITKRDLLNQDSTWGFFDLVEEYVDDQQGENLRNSLFTKDEEKVYRNISQWKHNWKAIREGISENVGFQVEETAESITLCYQSYSKSLKEIEQRITFSTNHPKISLDVSFVKSPVRKPEGIYFAFPLNLHSGWECVYDTADTFVQLDVEQLGEVCRDYITVDKSISIFDKEGGCTLACPDAPMIQVGGFQFGKENKQIERIQNPLLLAWPMNNYWDTNFAASEDGKMSFHYELSAFAEFNEKETYRMGIEAAVPCTVGAAVICEKQEEQEFLHYDSESLIPIFIRPQYANEGGLIAMKNFCDEEGNCTLSVPGRKISFAAITDIQGNTKKELEIIGNQVNMIGSPNALTFLKMCFK